MTTPAVGTQRERVQRPKERVPTRPEVMGWFVQLRWWAIGAQLALALGAEYGLGIQLPLFRLFTVLAMVAVSNLALSLAVVRSSRPSSRLAASALLFDTFALSALLYLTGGPLNPFSIVYLLHVVLAAVLLDARWTWYLTVLSVALFGALFSFHLPLPALEAHHHHHSVGRGADDLIGHLRGMWIAFAVVATLCAYFLTRILGALSRQERAVRELQALTQRHEQLAFLTALSAGTAHELATPLSTIAIAAGELVHSAALLPGGEPIAEAVRDDATLIRQEVERCRAILDQLALRGSELRGEMCVTTDTEALGASVLQSLSPTLRTRVELQHKQHCALRLPLTAVTRAIVVLVRNGFEASEQDKRVRLDIESEGERLVITVQDSGKGMGEEVLARLGEPFFTTKDGTERGARGLGLGVFSAKLLAHRLGGDLTFRSQPGKGTIACLTLPCDVVSGATLQAA